MFKNVANKLIKTQDVEVDPLEYRGQLNFRIKQLDEDINRKTVEKQKIEEELKSLTDAFDFTQVDQLIQAQATQNNPKSI